jgi:hypothetical protein
MGSLYYLYGDLAFCKPWVRGDGVGYYAYVRALLVERHLSFENDWRLANTEANAWAVGPSHKILANINVCGLEGPVEIVPYTEQTLALKPGTE